MFNITIGAIMMAKERLKIPGHTQKGILKKKGSNKNFHFGVSNRFSEKNGDVARLGCEALKAINF